MLPFDRTEDATRGIGSGIERLILSGNSLMASAMQDAESERLQQRLASHLDKADRRAKADMAAYERLKRAFAASKGGWLATMLWKLTFMTRICTRFLMQGCDSCSLY